MGTNVPDLREQEAFWDWVDDQINMETATKSDADCVCNEEDV